MVLLNFPALICYIRSESPGDPETVYIPFLHIETYFWHACGLSVLYSAALYPEISKSAVKRSFNLNIICISALCTEMPRKSSVFPFIGVMYHPLSLCPQNHRTRSCPQNVAGVPFVLAAHSTPHWVWLLNAGLFHTPSIFFFPYIEWLLERHRVIAPLTLTDTKAPQPPRDLPF